MRCPDEYGAPCGHRSCRRCSDDGSWSVTCPKCDGEGWHHDPGEWRNSVPCHYCNRTGRVYVKMDS